MALLHGEPRLATVRATELCVCWALDRDTFRKIMQSAGRNDMNARMAFLNKVPILAELTSFERFKIAEVRCVCVFEFAYLLWVSQTGIHVRYSYVRTW